MQHTLQEARRYDSTDYDLISVIRPGPRGIRTSGLLHVCMLLVHVSPPFSRSSSFSGSASKATSPSNYPYDTRSFLHQGIVKKERGGKKILRPVAK